MPQLSTLGMNKHKEILGSLFGGFVSIRLIIAHV